MQNQHARDFIGVQSRLEIDFFSTAGFAKVKMG